MANPTDDGCNGKSKRRRCGAIRTEAWGENEETGDGCWHGAMAAVELQEDY